MKPFDRKDAAYMAGCIALFLLLRFINVPQMLGNLFLR